MEWPSSGKMLKTPKLNKREKEISPKLKEIPKTPSYLIKIQISSKFIKAKIFRKTTTSDTSENFSHEISFY